MKKATKILWAVLCAGVLLMGAGTGMAFATYASFEYDDTSLKPEVNLQAEKTEVSIAAEGEVQLCCYWDAEGPCMSIEYDESVPKEEIWLTAKYDPAYTDIEVSSEQYQGEDGAMVTQVDVIPVHMVDDFDLFMESKDAILEGLKNGVLMEYDDSEAFGIDVTVQVNPANKDRVMYW